MNENVNVCITPKGDKPVLHFSQFDNERVFTVTVLADDGESAAVLTGLDIEFRLRKTDSHVVTIAPESVADNVITFKTTEQMCACCGQNIASVVLMKDDMNVSTLDILVDIQRDILSGGLTSESDIRNLTTQIEQIVPEVIGDDYYNKQEVDEKIAEIPTFDPTNYYDKNYINTMYWTAQQCDMHFYRKTYINSNYYNKSDVDGLLANKADNSDIPDSINDLSDVNTAGAVNGNALIYNNGTWVPGSGGGGGVPTIHELSVLSSAVTKNYAYYFEFGDNVFVTFSVTTLYALKVNDVVLSGLPLPSGFAFRFPSVAKASNANPTTLLTFVNSKTGNLGVAGPVASDIQITGSFFYKKA